ncbi:MAG: thioredoxin domain-containing protein, partial [Gemmatimonadota bacterium]|nr:thioredoxin domain-containing protein [Gemmatimonadota bacterium]
RGLAVANASFLRDRMMHDGRVMRTYKNGEARIPGFLEDHAAVALGLIATYEMTFDEEWLRLARSIADAMIASFWDASAKRIYDTAIDAEKLIIRPRDITDNAMPSGSSLAAELLFHLGDLYDVAEYREISASIVASAAPMLAQYPAAFGHLLGVIDAQIYGATEVALTGSPGSTSFSVLERAVATTYVPSLVVAGGSGGSVSDIALMRDRAATDEGAAAYVCRNYTCSAPVSTAAALIARLESTQEGSDG